MLQSMRSQRFRHDWATKEQQEEEQDIITGHLQILGRVEVFITLFIKSQLIYINSTHHVLSMLYSLSRV